MRRYYEFHGRQDPAELGAEHVTAFLNALATNERVSASTQNQALAALLFLYREVLGKDLPWLDGLVRAKTPARLPVVLTREEVRAVLSRMEGVPRMMATLLYGSGLRLLECCRLRVKDVDFARNQITVRRGKGDKDRATMLPGALKDDLSLHLERARRQHQHDLAIGAGWVELPGALARKLPSAGREWVWQWVFPATRIYVDRVTGERRRHHLHETVVQQAVRRAVLASGIAKRATCHTFRHSLPPRGRQRHPYGAGAARPRRRRHHDDLHPRPEPRPGRRPEPGGSPAQRLSMGSSKDVLEGSGRWKPSETCHEPKKTDLHNAVRRGRVYDPHPSEGAEVVKQIEGRRHGVLDRPGRCFRGHYADQSNTR
jgi:integron integrase